MPISHHHSFPSAPTRNESPWALGEEHRTDIVPLSERKDAATLLQRHVKSSLELFLNMQRASELAVARESMNGSDAADTYSSTAWRRHDRMHGYSASTFDL